MSAPKIYRWDDDNAPVLNGATGMLNKLLLACLVDGYGEKSGSGWVLQYSTEDKSVIALRNNPERGSGFFLHVVDTDTNVAKAQGYELMSDLDTGVGPFFNTALSPRKSYTADTTSRRWLLLATDTFFYFFAYPVVAASAAFDLTDSSSNNANISAFCFGDLMTLAEDGFATILGTGHLDYPNQSYARCYGLCEIPVTCGAPGDNYLSAPRPLAGTPNAPTALSHVTGGGPVYWVGSSNSRRTMGAPYQAGQLLLARPCVVDGASSNLRGFLPGFYYPCHGWEAFAKLALTTIIEDDRSFLVIPYSRHHSYNERTYMTILLSLDDWSL